jgi:hypothetical protein
MITGPLLVEELRGMQQELQLGKHAQQQQRNL